jgi:transposase
MKFKQKQAHNQRIERITSEHIVIGIDIAKESHVARAVDFRGIEIGKHITFLNQQQGFEALLGWVHSLQTKHNKVQLLVGMEPTGHYWLPLAFWLMEQRIEVVSVNPHHVKKGKEFKDNSPTKNDVKDALVIADMIKNGYYSTVRLPTKEYAELREYMYIREYLVKQLSSIKNRIHRWIDLRFPEFSSVFKTLEGKAALLTLQRFPTPQEVLALGVEGIVATWKKHMKRHCGISYAQALVEQAQRSVGTKDGLQAAKMSLAILLEQHEQLSSKLIEMEQQIAQLLEKLPLSKALLKIPGIGLNMVAALFAEAGDLGQYVHGRQLLRLAGLHLGEDSSGKHHGQIVITKRGRSRLRKVLYQCVFSLVKNNTEFRMLHQRNVEEKKMKKVKSLIALCGKLARILVGMARHKQEYLPQKVTIFSEISTYPQPSQKAS